MDKQTYQIIIEKTIYDSGDQQEMMINSTVYKPTLKEANKIAKEEAAKGHVVEIWKLVRRY
jgi:hypothetical protein